MRKPFAGLASGLLLSLLTSTAVAEVVVVVSTESPLESLSGNQLADIYMGRLVDLPTGDSVVPIDQSDRSPVHEAFYQKYLGRSAAQVKAHWSRLIFTGRGQPPRSVSDSEAVVELVSDNHHAIGYIDSSEVPVASSLRVVDIE